MRFGLYLVEEGRITAEQLVAALEAQLSMTPPLGQVALEEGKISVRDLFGVLRVQSDVPHDRFGDVAVELGLLSRGDLAELLMLQSDRQQSLSQILIEQSVLSSEDMEMTLEAFRQRMERGTEFGDKLSRAVRRRKIPFPREEFSLAD